MARRILLADDERNIIRLTQVLLERQGYEVITAFDGREALEKAEATPPDLAILDVMMPHIDGFEVLKRLRETEATHAVPVIMLTARRHDEDVLHGWEAGANYYLTKPFNPAELLALVQGIFGGNLPPADPAPSVA